MKISEITIGRRFRKDIGDVKDLAESMATVGQLYPVLITPSNVLLAGQRRIEAAKLLEWESVEAQVIECSDDLLRQLKIENDENTCRKDFTPSEAVEAAKYIKEALKETAQERKREGGKRGGEKSGETRRGETKHRGNLPYASQDESARTDDVAAKSVGMSRRTLSKAEKVVESGDQEAIAEMDTTGKVDRAYKKVTSSEPETEPESAEDRMKAHNKAVESWARSITDAIKSAPESQWLDEARLSVVKQQLQSAAGTARLAKGGGICPKCNGEGCKDCRKSGFLPTRQLEMVS